MLHAALHTVSFVNWEMHSDWFNGIEVLQGRWQHGEKVGYCYPSGLEKTLCKWDIYVPLVTKGLRLTRFLPCIRMLYLRIKRKTKVRRTANLLTQVFTSACLYVPLFCGSETHVATPLLPASKAAKTIEQANKQLIFIVAQTLLLRPLCALNSLKKKHRLLYLKPQSVPRSKHFPSRL